ncbi:MAG: NADH-quinone oxidoreductase subunit D [Candidatus Hodarchaeota archaeon]
MTAAHDEPFEISVGPQHPGSGHFRLLIQLDGDTIVQAKPDPGYVHRGVEKSAENRTFLNVIPMLERVCLPDVNNHALGYALTVERILDITPPERAQYLRVIMCELGRIMSHLYWTSIFGIFEGHSTAFMWGFADREVIIDLMEWVSGSRISYFAIVPGGVRFDVPSGFEERTRQVLDFLEKRFDEHSRMFFHNSILRNRTIGTGLLPAEEAIRLGVVGPSLRGSGIDSDIRIDEPYAAYPKLEVPIAINDGCDSYARCLVRLDEMRNSVAIIRQALTDLPEGDFRVKIPTRVKEGTAFTRVEAARGELCHYLVTDGTNKPYRLKITTPSFRNLPAIPYVLHGWHLADMPTNYMSLDYWPVDADR